MLFKSLFASALLITTTYTTYAQQSGIWTLTDCIKYANENNISIQEKTLDERLAKLNLQQGEIAQLPTINASVAGGKNYGNYESSSVGGGVVTQNYNFLSGLAYGDLLVFGWFQRRNSIARDRLDQKAASSDLDQLKNDVSLNIATAYLRALQAKEQININEKQIGLTKAQLSQTSLQAQAGTLPDLGVALLQAQLITDSTNLLVAVSTYRSSILDIKAILNLGITAPFETVAPDSNTGRMIDLAVTDPETIYSTARDKFSSIRQRDYLIEAARKTQKIAQAETLPRLDIVAQLGTAYTNIYKNYVQTGSSSISLPSTYVNVNGTQLPVTESVPTYDSKTVPFSEQLDHNFTQTYGLSLYIPIFNAWSSKYNMQRARINVDRQVMEKQIAETNLQRDIYKAYSEAKIAVAKYNSSLRANGAANRALRYVKQRYDIGIATPVEYLSVQNTVFGSNSQLLSAKYEMIFKLKILDYYMGNDLTLN